MRKTLDETALDALVRVIGHLRTWASSFVSLLRVVLLFGVTAVWVAFWGAVVRLHLSMGDVFAAIITTLLCVGPVLIVGLGWASRTVRDDRIEFGPIGL
jgi:hypothetical protein